MIAGKDTYERLGTRYLTSIPLTIVFSRDFDLISKVKWNLMFSRRFKVLDRCNTNRTHIIRCQLF